MNSEAVFFAVSFNIGHFHAGHIILTVSVLAGSRFVKDLRFFSYLQAKDDVVTFSWKLERDMKLPGQRQRSLLLKV